MNHLEEIFSKNNGSIDYFTLYSRHLADLLSSIDNRAIKSVVDCFLEARKDEKTVYFAGNGGSAATASHFAQDLAEVGRKAKVKSFKAISLTDNVPFITAVSNDYGYNKIFSVQMAEIFNKGDVIVLISASGNSPNVIEAAHYAKTLDGITVGLVGFEGGALSKICDHVVHVETLKGEYGPVEDVHMILDHMITSYLTLKLAEEGNAK